jgi:hypothetical protein
VSKRYSGGWEGRQHFEWWVQWRFDDSWDRDTDPPARIVLAWSYRELNEATALSCLLNQWERKDGPEAWDRARAFLAEPARETETVSAFETAAEKLLQEIGHLSPGQAMGGEKDARDRRLELKW